METLKIIKIFSNTIQFHNQFQMIIYVQTNVIMMYSTNQRTLRILIVINLQIVHKLNNFNNIKMEQH